MITALDVNNLPTRRDENWKYTNLSRALGAKLLGAVPQGLHEILIHRNSKEQSSKAEEILWVGEDGLHHNLRLKIVLDAGAELTVIERHEGSGSYWKNMSTEIILGENSRLNHIRIQNDDLSSVHTNMVHITMERDSCLNSFSLNMGAKLSRHEINAVLNGSGIECSLNGVNLLRSDQHGDTTILMEHLAPHCVSRQLYRTILDDNSRGVFQGKIYVDRVAQKTEGYQLSNALLLSDKSEMDTKPELEIYADDVKCSHGATTGQLDEAPLFYLRARGLSTDQARMLLIQAFINEPIDQIKGDNIAQDIKDRAAVWVDTALQEYE